LALATNCQVSSCEDPKPRPRRVVMLPRGSVPDWAPVPTPSTPNAKLRPHDPFIGDDEPGVES
jgi:hypothetical protein